MCFLSICYDLKNNEAQLDKVGLRYFVFCNTANLLHYFAG